VARHGMSDAGDQQPRPLAICRSYHDLRRAIVDWCERIGMSRAELDLKADLAEGHSGKLLAPRAIKKFGAVSLGRVLAAAGLVLIVAVEPEADDVDVDLRERVAAAASGSASERTHGQRPGEHWRSIKGTAWARRMNGRRALKLSPARRREIARQAAQARWRRRPILPTEG
jgi:hypothetical protein